MDRAVFAADGNDALRPEAIALAAPLETSMVCTCVVAIGPKVCFATYNEDENKIIIEESPSSGYDIEGIAERYLALARPNLLLVGSSIVSNQDFLETLTKPLAAAFVEENESENNSSTAVVADHNRVSQGRASTTTHSRRSIPYKLLKTGAFDHGKCKALILDKLRVLSIMRQTQNNSSRMGEPIRIFPEYVTGHRTFQVSSYNSIGSLIDMDSSLQVKCIGALLTFLENTVFKLEDGGTITVNDIVHAKSSKYMNINASTISALNIFATEHHPLVVANGKGNSKEGSSLFSLLDRTKSKGGRQMLRNWMLKPLQDRDEIIQRQDGVEFFCSQIDCEGHIGAIIVLLQEIGPIHQILNRFQKCAALPMDFVTMARTMSAATEICKILEVDILERLRSVEDARQSTSLFPGSAAYGNLERGHMASCYTAFVEKILYRCNVPVLKELQEQIVFTIDEESTSEAKDTIFIRNGFHEELDMWKAHYNSLDETLAAIRETILAMHPNLGELAVVFVPQLGFLIGLEKSKVFRMETRELRLSLPQDFTHVCNSENGYAYFKNTDMTELDNTIGDLDGMIKDTESTIVSELEDDILDHETDLRDTFLALSELDCVIALAEAAKDKNYTRPAILDNRDAIIRITNGRHPLQEILVEADFIPNDTDINPRKRVNIVTGPNFSGKSCYARQVGVLVYMAHIGSFLPCDGAQISIFHQIFAHFSSVETCAVPQSSFQLDLTQMGTILRRSTSRSLVLVDEFGKGTSPASGIALLTAAIKKLSATETSVVCTTHFLEMFSRKLLTDGENGLKALRMAVRIPQDKEDSAYPLFKLEEGVADSSAGIICAKMAGMNSKVVERAKQVLQAQKDGRELEPEEEVLRNTASNILTPQTNDVIKSLFSRQSWRDATDQDVQILLQKIAKI